MKIKSLYKLILMIALVGISLSTRAQDFGDEGGGEDGGDGSGQTADPNVSNNPDPGYVVPPYDPGCCPGSCCPGGLPPGGQLPPDVPNPVPGQIYIVQYPDGSVVHWISDGNGGWTWTEVLGNPIPPDPGNGTGGSTPPQGVTGNGVQQNADGSYSIYFPDGTIITTNTDGTYNVSGGQGTCNGCSASDVEADIPPGEQPPILPPNPTPGQQNAYNQAYQLYLASQAANGSAPGSPPPPNPANPCAYYIPSTASQADRINDLNTLMGTEADPFAIDFIPSNTPPDLAQDWKNLATFTISPDKMAKLNALVHTETTVNSLIPGSVITSTDVAHVQSINDGYSSVINMDYFPVNVTKLPNFGGTQWSALNLLQYFRTNINSFVNTSYSSFAPYDYYGVDDRALWYSANPDGAIVSITIPGDDGSVITTFPFLANNWTFTTIHDPYNGDHPVSGNRQFGFTLNADGSYTFYTKGVDRLTGVLGTLLQSTTGVPFKDADALWTSFQNGLVNWINLNGGAATVVPPTKNRPNWDLVKQVLNGTVPPCAIAPH